MVSRRAVRCIGARPAKEGRRGCVGRRRSKLDEIRGPGGSVARAAYLETGRVQRVTRGKVRWQVWARGGHSAPPLGEMRRAPLGTVELVAEHGESEQAQMSADLMGPSGMRSALEQRAILPTPEHFYVGARAPSG